MPKFMDMSEAFAEVEAQAMAEHKARVASGQEEKDMQAFRERSAAENAQMEANGCIETETEKHTCWDCGVELDEGNTSDEDSDYCEDCLNTGGNNDDD